MIIDDEVLWKIEDPRNILTWKKFGEYTDGAQGLKSDTSQRIDVEPIQTENWEEAEKNKLELEELQRADKKLR